MILQQNRKLYLFLFSLVWLMGCAATTSIPTSDVQIPPSDEDVPAGKIVIGDIGANRVQKIEDLQPLADYLASQLHDYGIGIGEVKVAPDVETMVEWINSGEVDVFMDSAYPTMLISNETDIEVVLRQWHRGVGEYESVIFAKSDVISLYQLQGKIIAFDEAYSSSGFMLPYTFLRESGYHLREVISPDEPVATDEIGYVFTGSNTNTVEWVLDGRVLAGATGSSIFDEEIPAETKANLIDLGRSRSVPRHIVSIPSDMDPALRMAVIEILKGMDDTEAGIMAMSFSDTDRFDLLPGGIDQTMLLFDELFALLDSNTN